MVNTIKEFFKDYKSKLFAIYYGRWILSAFVMMPFMILFEYFNIPLWLNLILGQTVGSLIFFKIDQSIFSGKESHVIEEEFNEITHH